MDTPTDEELMVSYQQGSQQAFETLYQRHSSKIYGYLMNRTKNPAKASDLFQQTFLKLHNHRHQYQNSFPFLPWIFTVCQSVLIDDSRKLSNRNEKPDENIIQLADHRQSNEQGVPIQKQNIDLSVLDERSRKAVELRYLEEYEFEQIAERLETSPANVRKIISRAIKAIRTKAKGARL